MYKAIYGKTPLQSWARTRNLSGGAIGGVISTLRELSERNILTPYEAIGISIAINVLRVVIKYWRTNNELSKRIFLEKGDD
jgi:hypothetical protein